MKLRMINPESAAVAFILIALLLFAFVYWRDATSEGFSSDKILDSFFAILLGGLIGGKLLFRELNLDYFRYQFLMSPLIFEGVLVGGGVFAYLVIKRNQWDGWKIGDMIAPAISMFQLVLFFGFWLKTRQLSMILLFFGFAILYYLIRSLKKNRHLGTSSRYFELKRLNRLTFTGGLLAMYLTGSSLIAILFLLTHQNWGSWFWWFQVSFYLSVLTASYILIRRRLIIQGVKMNPIVAFGKASVEKVEIILNRRKKQIKQYLKIIDKNDPFIKEAEEGFRNEDELGDEVQDFQQHEINEAVKTELKEEEKEIEESLDDISKGKYGYCDNCGVAISKARLKAYPTATTCLNCEQKSRKSD